MTQFVIRRWGRTGAVVSEAACTALMVRDAAMVASGAPRRLRRAPATLLWLELSAAVAATAAGLPLAMGRKPPFSVELVRRAAVGTLFGLHTFRFGIYLRPDQGRRQLAA